MENTINLIEIKKDGNQWCAMYPMGSNLMECDAVEFSPMRPVFDEFIGRTRDYGKYDVLHKLKTNNPNLPTTSFYCDYWD